jgi:hypothetical protein
MIQFVDIFAFTCFGQLTIFKRHRINMFRNYYYKVRNTHLEVLHKVIYNYLD